MPTSRRSLEEAREERLLRAVAVAGWWLLAQGCLYFLLDGRWAGRLLRYDIYLVPYLRGLALSLLCLGFFVLKSLRDPRRQYLAVDILILYLLGQVYCALEFRLGYHALLPWEWLSGAVNLGLALALVVNRTRSSRMRAGAGSLVAEPALDLARQTAQWVQKKGPLPKPGLGDLEVPPGPETKKSGKGSSEALPHMD